MMHQYDHRWATYDPDGVGGEVMVRDSRLDEKHDPSFSVLPRYWVNENDVDRVLGERWRYDWLLGWRDIARATDERTTIAGVIPRAAVGNNLPTFAEINHSDGVVLASVLSSFALDFTARLKVGGTHLNFFIVQQLPIIAPSRLNNLCPWESETPTADWLTRRTTELVYVARDLGLAFQDLGDRGSPFEWDAERRTVLRAELDAAFFHLYGLSRDEVEYVMETFPIVRRKDEAAYGEYRTKRLILENYDAMTRAIATGTTFASTLSPAPGAGPRHTTNDREAAGR